MFGVVGVGRGDPGEHLLVALAGQDVAILERGAPEIGQQGVARTVDLDLANELELGSIEGLDGALGGLSLKEFLRCFTARHD